jgi:2-polyprenyl-3-methyl-5-hydroxy-6-metoxy-1,4-benzoquinol methylase
MYIGDPRYFGTYSQGKWFLKYLEARCLRCSDGVIVNCEETLDGYLKHFPGISGDKFRVITDGYDQNSYDLSRPIRSERFRILYTGQFYTGAREPLEVFKALRSLKDIPIEFVIAGEVPDSCRAILSENGIGDKVKVLGYRQNDEVRALQKGADVLLNIGWSGGYQLPGKMFDYMAAKRVILTVKYDDKDVSSRFIEKYRRGLCCSNVSTEITAAIRRLYDLWRTGHLDCSFNLSTIKDFEWSKLTEDLEACMLSLLTKKRKKMVAIDMVSCPGCKAEVNTLEPLDKYCSGGRQFKLHQCGQCDLQFWHPRCIDASNYQSIGIYDTSVGLHGLNIWHRPFFKLFPFTKGRLLDIGCSDGGFLAEAQKCGFDVFGTDFDKEAVAAVVNKRGIKACSKSLDDFVTDDVGIVEPFDVVTFFEVLEHQEDPLRFLCEVKRVMKNGGWIAGSVPNRNRFIIKREYQDYPPNHYIRFSRKSLINILNESGFSNIEVYDRAFRSIDLAIFLETQIFGTFAEAIKMGLKKRLLGANKAQAKALAIENLKDRSSFGYIALKAMRFLRNMIFLLPAAVLRPILRPHLYFQAKNDSERHSITG